MHALWASRMTSALYHDRNMEPFTSSAPTTGTSSVRRGKLLVWHSLPCPETNDCLTMTAGPISSPGCPWQFGIFEEHGADDCAPFYSECVWGVPERKLCHPKGLVYDERIKGCNWPDAKGCKGEELLGVKCPADDKYNPFYPYPRYLYNEKAIVVCVDEQPRLIHCPEHQIVDEKSYTCVDIHKEDQHPWTLIQ